MGFTTKKYTTYDFEVPNEWIFEYFLNLPEKLNGQTVSIKSIWNENDTNPSMKIYLHDSGRYKFNDFSSGKSGDGVDLLQIILQLPNRQKAFEKALELYKQSDQSYEKIDFIQSSKAISNYQVRKWNKNDQRYWTAYKIGSKTLINYNIKPLENYTFEIRTGEHIEHKTFAHPFSYGFFTKDNKLYKIYNPKSRVAKFIKVKDYIQGSEQLTQSSKWLMICSSLKDILAFNSLGYPIECIAPDSENVMLTETQIEQYKKDYKFITVLFDNDGAGKKATQKYVDAYGLTPIYFNVEKDLAKCVKEHGIKNTKFFIKPFLLKAKNERLQKNQKIN